MVRNAALLAPSALSLLTTTFTDLKERGRAFGVYGAVAASGSGLGLLLGGALTSYLSWRWCLYVNLVFAAIAVSGGALLLGRQARTPVFWWCAVIFAAGAVICGALLRRGPLTRPGTFPPASPLGRLRSGEFSDELQVRRASEPYQAQLIGRRPPWPTRPLARPRSSTPRQRPSSRSSPTRPTTPRSTAPAGSASLSTASR